MIQIYHNPRCSKSRECLITFEGMDEEVEIIRYLDNPPTEKELKSIVKKLKIKPIDLVRKNEKEWAAFKDSSLSDSEIIKLMSKFPILIERPIVISGDKAVVARPLEKALALIKSI